jgi:parallel beta-helix repeat protein
VGNSGWVDFKNAGGCTGNGTSSSPYLIKNLVIDGHWLYNCVTVENSNVYFRIENCTLFNGGSIFRWEGYDAGMYLSYVSNAQIFNNTFYNNNCGISILYSNYSTISGNRIRDSRSSDCGISLFYSNNNNISKNRLRDNEGAEIELIMSNNNTLEKNTIRGKLVLRSSNYNTVIENEFLSAYEGCWAVTSDCVGNIFLQNYCFYNEAYLGRLIIFLVILSSIIGIIVTCSLTIKWKT